MLEEIIKKLVSHKLVVIDLNNILKNRYKGRILHVYVIRIVIKVDC